VLFALLWRSTFSFYTMAPPNFFFLLRSWLLWSVDSLFIHRRNLRGVLLLRMVGGLPWMITYRWVWLPHRCFIACDLWYRKSLEFLLGVYHSKNSCICKYLSLKKFVSSAFWKALFSCYAKESSCSHWFYGHWKVKITRIYIYKRNVRKLIHMFFYMVLWTWFFSFLRFLLISWQGYMNNLLKIH
jgi:hypothetical protein